MAAKIRILWRTGYREWMPFAIDLRTLEKDVLARRVSECSSSLKFEANFHDVSCVPDKANNSHHFFSSASLNDLFDRCKENRPERVNPKVPAVKPQQTNSQGP
jgi:hypothetical protein